jgi:hypothetical protein
MKMERGKISQFMKYSEICKMNSQEGGLIFKEFSK